MTPATATSPRAWMASIIDHNPCYILSGLCMLFGCYLLNAALYTPAGDIRKLLTLLAVLNIYELLLVGLGLLLIQRDVLRRDAWIVLGLEALFVCDITFTSGIIATINSRWGLAIAIGLIALTAIKTGILFRALRAPFPIRCLLFVLLQITLLHLTPVYFRHVSAPRHGRLPETIVYAFWWAAAA